MTVIRLLLCTITLLSLATSSLAEGFSMTEWSARGLSLAGGMVGRADDASALAYNAAGITQLPGTQIMLGATVVRPYGTQEAMVRNARTGQSEYQSASLKDRMWFPPHAYITHQLNDNIWLGCGMFTRYGLGLSYKGDWFGKHNVYDIGLSTVSVVPTIAYKFNDHFSVSAGLELMHLHWYEGIKVPTTFTDASGLFANNMQLQGYSWGLGAHFGLHGRINDQWSIGLAYKTQVTQNVNGDVEFARQGSNRIRGSIDKQYNSDAHATLQLPDSVALGIAYKPLENLNFEAGLVWTRWSTFNHLNIYLDEPSGYRSLNNKQWRDGWNFNASVEYKPVDWLALRAGYWYETPVVNEKYADYLVPSYGRDVLTLGAGILWENWRVDIAYAHIWVHELDYGQSQVHGIRGVVTANTHRAGSSLYSLSVGYTF